MISILNNIKRTIGEKNHCEIHETRSLAQTDIFHKLLIKIQIFRSHNDIIMKNINIILQQTHRTGNEAKI